MGGGSGKKDFRKRKLEKRKQKKENRNQQEWELVNKRKINVVLLFILNP